MNASFKNILLIQFGDIGDVVLTTPAIRAVKETFPDARVSILVRKPFGNLLVADPNLFEVVESSRPRGGFLHVANELVAFARHLKKARYDLVIDLRTGDRGAISSFLTGAKVRVGRSGTANQFWHKLMFTRIVHPLAFDPSAHPGAAQSLCILHEIGVDTKNSIPQLHISRHDAAQALSLFSECGLTQNSKLATINPFSRWKYKEWDAVKWKEVIDYLWRTHRIQSILIGSQEEAAASTEIVRGREDHAFNLAGKTTLGELAALISMSSLHLGVDSAAPHIAAALDRPSITIHGPSDWRSWRLVDDFHRVIVPSMECVPCSRMGCDDSGSSRCLDLLEVGTVTDAIDEVLRKLSPLEQHEPPFK